MFIVQSYFVAVVMCVITMICWGSWANTQKLASKEWKFQLFYWDYSIGVLLLTLLLSFAVASALVFIPKVIPASLTGLFAILVYSGISLLLFKYLNIWLVSVAPLTSGMLTLLGGSIVAYQYATKDKKFLNSLLINANSIEAIVKG